MRGCSGGVRGCSQGGCAWFFQGCMHGCSGGVCGCSVEGCAWDTTRYEDTVNERAVPILLEYILVLVKIFIRIRQITFLAITAVKECKVILVILTNSSSFQNGKIQSMVMLMMRVNEALELDSRASYRLF